MNTWYKNGSNICKFCGKKMCFHKPLYIYVRGIKTGGFNPCLSLESILNILNTDSSLTRSKYTIEDLSYSKMKEENNHEM